jgi:protein-tyrosine phosphatase
VFEQTYNFIKRVKDSGEKVLVHCQAGVSRSPTVSKFVDQINLHTLVDIRVLILLYLVCAYLMREYGWTAEKALLHTYGIRKCVSPNIGFMKQLFKYQNELGIEMTEELLKPIPLLK